MVRFDMEAPINGEALKAGEPEDFESTISKWPWTGHASAKTGGQAERFALY
jgi:hypothetical protein